MGGEQEANKWLDDIVAKLSIRTESIGYGSGNLCARFENMGKIFVIYPAGGGTVRVWSKLPEMKEYEEIRFLGYFADNSLRYSYKNGKTNIEIWVYTGNPDMHRKLVEEESERDHRATLARLDLERKKKHIK